MAPWRPSRGEPQVGTGGQGHGDTGGEAEASVLGVGITVDMLGRADVDRGAEPPAQTVCWALWVHATCVVTKATSCPEHLFDQRPCLLCEVTHQEVLEPRWVDLHGLELLKAT